MSKKVSITLTSDLFEHLEALKLYYGYKSRSAVVEKALDELISKCVSDEVFHYYLACAREIMRDMEGEQ
jgi:metal-responsive CopG/Arc/MetJ family transcriptional regulator